MKIRLFLCHDELVLERDGVRNDEMRKPGTKPSTFFVSAKLPVMFRFDKQKNGYYRVEQIEGEKFCIEVVTVDDQFNEESDIIEIDGLVSMPLMNVLPRQLFIREGGFET